MSPSQPFPPWGSFFPPAHLTQRSKRTNSFRTPSQSPWILLGGCAPLLTLRPAPVPWTSELLRSQGAVLLTQARYEMRQDEHPLLISFPSDSVKTRNDPWTKGPGRYDLIEKNGGGFPERKFYWMWVLTVGAWGGKEKTESKCVSGRQEREKDSIHPRGSCPFPATVFLLEG